MKNFDDLDLKFKRFQDISRQAQGLSNRQSKSYVQRCDDDLCRLLNSYSLSFMDWSEHDQVNLDEKALAKLDNGTLEGKYSAFKFMINMISESKSTNLPLTLLCERSENTIISLLTSYFLNCYDLIIMMGGQMQETPE